MEILVLKFGGTSVSKRTNWENIVSIVNERLIKSPKVLIVCSALSGVSNQLEKIVTLAVKNEHGQLFSEIKKRHQEMALELGIDFYQVVAPHFADLERILSGIAILQDGGPKNWARVLAYGELFSTALGHAFLNKMGVANNFLDARDYLLALDYEQASQKKRYLEAVCECVADKNLMDNLSSFSERVLITQGFIARNGHGETVLLGRGGSDVSASYFAAKIQSPWLEIWTDVPGMFTANPKLISQARLLKELSYDEALEIASSGAKVLHPRCIPPVQKAGIPLHVYSTERPDLSGTIISHQSAGAPKVKAISMSTGIVLISMDTTGMWQQVGFLANIFATYKKWGISINQVSTSETNVTVALDAKQNHLDQENLNGLLLDLKKDCEAKIISGCASVALVGRNIRHILHTLAPAFKTFEDHQVYLIVQSSSDLNLTCIVDETQADRLTKQLHQYFFKEDMEDLSFGPMWSEIFECDEESRIYEVNQWWLQQRERVLTLMKRESTPCYLYDLNQVENACTKLKSVKSVDRFLYAVKANNNELILKHVAKQGFSFECVSLQEVLHILRIVPNIQPNLVLFTPNFAPAAEYKRAFELGVQVTLDGLYPLEHWPELFQGREIFVRMDPGIGRGHHKFVCTAGNESKFGVPLHQVERLKELTKRESVKVVGLHAHMGSGVLSAQNWFEMGRYLMGLLDHFDDVRVIDLGGGLGIPYKGGDRSLDLEHLQESLLALKGERDYLEFWMEPGRFVVADAGVLIARVTQIKPKGDQFYVGIDAGMNSLIRPALYGAHHEIVNLSRINDQKSMICNIVGPICESGDILGHARRLPASTEEGDIILIATAGAYGRVMGSHYTMREPARELFLNSN